MDSNGKVATIDDKSDENILPNYIDIVDTAIPEYLEIVKNEYQIERDKKQSFENRAGLIITILAAVCIFFFEKVQISEIIDLITTQITFLLLVKILAGIIVYVGFIFTIIMIIRTISIKKHDNFEVKSIDEELLIENRLMSLCRLVFTYRDIIKQHRIENEKRASAFKNALLGMSATIICTVIYISI